MIKHISLLLEAYSNLCKIILFIDHSALLSGLTSSLLASCTVGLFLIYIFRSPKFSLEINFFNNGNIADSVLSFYVKNDKRFMYYEAETVHCNFLLPYHLLKDIHESMEVKNKMNIIFKDKKVMSENFLDLAVPGEDLIYKIKDENYYLIQGLVGLDLPPKISPLVFQLIGKFRINKKIRVYYWLTTRYGSYPKKLFSMKVDVRPNSKIADFKKVGLLKRLPFTDLEIK